MNKKYYYSFKSGTKYPIDATPPIEDGPYGIFPTFERVNEISMNILNTQIKDETNNKNPASSFIE